MCASNSAAFASPNASKAKRAALLTSRRTGPSAAAKIRAAQSASASVGDGFDGALRHRIARMMDMRDNRPSHHPEAADDGLADPLAASGDDCCCSLFMLAIPLLCHCERSEAIQRRNWIASLASAPRNDTTSARNSPPLEAQAKVAWRLVKARIQAAAARRRSTAGIPSIAAIRACASPATGSWFHEGVLINARQAMVRLFASVLRGSLTEVMS